MKHWSRCKNCAKMYESYYVEEFFACCSVPCASNYRTSSFTYRLRDNLSLMSETDIAWLGGLVTADGCVNPQRKNRNRGPVYASLFDLKMCDLDTVEDAASMLGVDIKSYDGGVTLKGNKGKRKYAIRLESYRANMVNRKILPYLSKRKQLVAMGGFALHPVENQRVL